MSDSDKRSVRGRHLLYKAGTKKVIDWLIRTAGALRDITQILDVRQKKSKFTIKARDLVTLANIITSASATAPCAIVQLLGKVIAGRRACAEFYAEHKSSAVAENRSHTFFVKILEDVYGRLAASQAHVEHALAPSQPADTASHGKDLETELINIFARLEVEEPSNTPLGASPGRSEKADALEATDVDLEDEGEDAAFALWCHCEDLRDLRQYVQEIWQQYAHGSISLLAASMVSETAMALMRLANNEFASENPELGSWDNLVAFLCLKCSSFMSNDKEVCTSYLYPKDNRIFSRNIKEGDEIIDLLCTGAASTLKEVVSEVRRSEQIRTSTHDVHVVLDQDTFSFARLLHHEIRNLADRLQKHRKIAEQSSEFIYGLADYYNSDILPIWLVSAAQTYCDIYEVIGSTPACASNYYPQRMSSLAESLHSFKKCKDLCKLRTDLSSYLGSMSLSVNLSQEIAKKTRITQEMIDFSAKAQLQPEDINPLEQQFSDALAAHYGPGTPLVSLFGLPCLAGQLLYSSMLSCHSESSQCVNTGGMMVAMANIYSACRQSGYLKSAWPDMDRVLGSQKASRPLVLKSSTNTSGKGVLHQYLVSLGVPASRFSKGKTPACPKLDNYYLHGRQLVPTCKFFSGLNTKKMTNRAAGFQRGEVLQMALAQLREPPKLGQRKSINQKVAVESMEYSLTEVLHAFKMSFVKEEPQLNFDFLGFWLFCRDIHLDLAEAFDRKDYPAPFELVHRILEDGAGNETLRSNASLSAASRILQKAIGDRGNYFSREALAQSSGNIAKHLRPRLRQWSDCLPDGTSPDANCKEYAAHLKESEGFSTVIHAASLNFYDDNGTDEEFQHLKRIAAIGKPC